MSIIAISGKINSGKDTVAKMIQFFDAVDKAKAKGIKKTYSFEEYNKYNLLGISTWEIKKWADSIKDTVCDWIGCTREQLEDREFKEKPLGEEWSYWIYEGEKYDYLSSDKQFFRDKGLKLHHHTPRSLMQLLGTEAGREIIHPNIWVNALMSGYSDKIMSGKDKYGEPENWLEMPKWIISDTRFPNEAKAVRARDGVLIRINRNTLRGLTNQAAMFEEGSHTQLSNWKAPHLSETALDNWKDWDYIIDNDGSLEDLLIKVKQIYEELHNT